MERWKKSYLQFCAFSLIYITFTKGTRHQSPAVWPYLGRTEASTDMVGVPTNQAWPEDHAGAIKNPEFRIRIELELENWFSRWYLYYIVQRGAGASQKAAEGRILASFNRVPNDILGDKINVTLTFWSDPIGQKGAGASQKAAEGRILASRLTLQQQSVGRRWNMRQNTSLKFIAILWPPPQGNRL